MNEKQLQEAERLANRHYTITTSEDTLSDGSIIFMARNPELQGCKAQGKTRTEAVNNLRDARIDYIYYLLEDGIDVPVPKSQEQVMTAGMVVSEQMQFKQTGVSKETREVITITA
jgi:predicted RNase H-like HicB family nuclease